MSRPLVVDLYARLSRCPSDGSLEKIETQLADCRRVAENRGWTIGIPHTDPNMSAWKRDRRRPGWDALLARIKSGEIDGVVCWHTDRLLRQPADLEELINLADANRLTLASAYGEHDLTNSDHRLAMRINAATACKASDDTSRRLKSRFATRRETGHVHGGARAFGFPGGDRTAERDEQGKLPAVPAALVERERAAIRQAAEDVADGVVSLAGIAARWNEAGLRSSTGAEWLSVTVRDVLARPRNAGLIEHDGVVVSRMPGDPILDAELYERLRAVFAGRRRGGSYGTHSYLASGIVLCGECGKALSGRPHNGTYQDGEPRRQYHCPKGRGGCGSVAADVRRVDEVLRAWVLRTLGDPAHVARLAAAAADTAQRATELTEQITRAQTLAQQLSDRVGRQEIELDEYDTAMRPLRKTIARLKAERDALTAEPAGETPDPDVETGELARRWDEGNVAERRPLLVTALRGMRARLMPADGSRVWSPARMRIRPIRPHDHE